MIPRWCLGSILGVALVAGLPAQSRTQAWVLAVDGRGEMVGDLKPEEFQVKVDGKVRPVVQVKSPNQTADAPQSWVLVFEPIRDPGFRATAFLAAADFLAKVPKGDKVLIVARGKDSLESLMPGFTLRRSLWAEALAKLPDLLPESLVGISKDSLQGMGFRGQFLDDADGQPGQDSILALLNQYRAAAPGWAKGTPDVRGVRVLDRLNFDNPLFVRGLIGSITRETKVLGSLLDLLAPVEGQKHVIVFSRCEADDMAHPDVQAASIKKFKRTNGDLGGPAETAQLASREITLLQIELKNRAVADGVTVYSVAGTGQTTVGLIGVVAPSTGGFAYPLSGGIELQFGQRIQVFGSRYFVQWSENGIQGAPTSLDINATRKDVKVIAQTLR